MAVKLLNLLALSSLAILATSFAPVSVNALVTAPHQLHARHFSHVAKKKRSSNSKRCKARPSSSSSSFVPSTSTVAPSPSPDPQPAQQAAAPPAPSSSSSSSAQADPSPAPASAPAPAPPSNSGGSGKVGLAWPNGDGAGLQNFITPQVSTLYTWSPSLPSNLFGLQGVPMLWGSNQVDQFQQLVKQGYANTVLGMNEPNESGQSNMSPQDGANLWMQYIQPLKAQGYKLITPATSSNPNGLVWVQQFMSACQGCTYDAVAVHWYDVTAQAFIDYLNLWHNTFNLPIWVTEFACQNFNGGAQCSADEVNSFMSTVTGFMNSTPWVEQYFAFGVMQDMSGVNPLNQLMNSNNQPTALGQMYINGN